MAVNPFQSLPIYTPQVEKLYHDTVKSAAPPHIFAIADQAYHSLVRNSKNQCAVIRCAHLLRGACHGPWWPLVTLFSVTLSQPPPPTPSGESGAGKTESAKLLMKHIIKLCHMGSEGELLERKIIEVNPLLEAFGNAQTLMNHNSSRFGKYTELDFDARGAVVGAQISEYLLEKSRVVRQNAGAPRASSRRLKRDRPGRAGPARSPSLPPCAGVCPLPLCRREQLPRLLLRVCRPKRRRHGPRQSRQLSLRVWLPHASFGQRQVSDVL